MTDRIEMFFPGGKAKAFTLSYDDGRDFDRRLAQMFRQRGVKATFNLNSGKLGQPGYISAEEIPELYPPQCAEVATHGMIHAFLDRLPSHAAFEEIARDRVELEKLTGRIIRGHAYPFGAYNDRVIGILRDAGIAYARTVNSTHSTTLPEDWLQWHPSCHHNDPELGELADRFLSAPPFFGAQLLYVWGHSYEFGLDDSWGVMEKLLDKTAGRDDVWYATNMEIYDYVQAFRSLQWSADCARVINPTAVDVWLSMGGTPEPVCIPAGSRDISV